MPHRAPKLKIPLAALCCWTLVAGAVEGQPQTALVLADKGRTDFSIVLPSKPSPVEKFAASELKRYLKMASGASFPITSKPGKRFILVCQRDSVPPAIPSPPGISQLSPEGYCLAMRHGGLFVVGADERGTLYAVYDLLERLGCRWLAPAFSYYQGAGEMAPRRETMSLNLAAGVVEKPALKYRKLYVEEGRSHNATNLLQMIDWMPKRRFNTLVVPLNYLGQGRVTWDHWRAALTPELQKRGLWIEVGGHGYENFLNADMEAGHLFERRPEWFGMNETGQRTGAARAVFCTSNEKAAEYFTSNVVRCLADHPEIEIFDFWPPDGAQWCQCPNCKALGAPSDRQALLLAKVSAAVHQTRPAIKFECIAYADCVAPPARTALNTNVLVDFCPIEQDFERQINDPKSARNAAYMKQFANWLQCFKGDIGVYSYYRRYFWQSLPVLLPHYMQHDLRFYRDLGARGISSYAEPGDWAAYELNHYALGQLAWNPEADVDEIIRDFAQARFGPQAALGRKVYQALEDNVRVYCSLIGTPQKTPAEYQRAADTFLALAQEIDAARKTAPASVSAALSRLGLMVEYVRRDLALQQARAEHGDARQRKAMIEDLLHFLHEHDEEGILVGGRIRTASQFSRYGLPKEQ
jgi:hypothetical protein